ncbi:hypothetical protein R2F61_00970 [Mollicutes bacterium LVI A0078]|nr:hypothetical protein RZE84_00970 [Mollicutes bacterium LVI A0075]WOO91151.1 hypothetical protein R2F61_00970 [Mollicutes bacterium LVI A0078]
MEKIVVSRKMLADAYNNAFLNLEKMNYETAGKLIEFVEANDYPVEQDMVDYAKVIIYSNSGRVDEAVKLSERMLSRGLQTQELQMIVNDVHAQLLKQKEFSDRRKKKVDKVSIQEVVDFLETVKPSDSKLADFINIFSRSIEEENDFIKYYQNSEIDEDSSMVANMKMIVAKLHFIEDTYKTLKHSSDDAKTPLYAILSKTILASYSNTEFLMFLNMHKTGLIKEMLIDEGFDARVRSFLGYQLDEMYTNKLVGRINVEMMIGGEIYKESIADLNKNFNNTIETYGEALEKLFTSGEVHEDYTEQLIAHFQRMISYTYPVINPINMDVDTFIASFLYVISNNNYNSQFNAIIEDVYKLNQESVRTEMQMIEVLLLI